MVCNFANSEKSLKGLSECSIEHMGAILTIGLFGLKIRYAADLTTNRKSLTPSYRYTLLALTFVINLRFHLGRNDFVRTERCTSS